MRKTITLIIFLLYTLCFGQIDVKIVSLEKTSSSTSEITISITNLTNSYYAIPLDKKSFKGYNSDELCSGINNFNNPYNFFAFTVVFKDRVTNEPAISLIRSYHSGDDQLEKLNRKDQKEKRKITRWQKENGLKSDFEAKRNLYVMNHLLFLTPKQNLILKMKLDIFDIKRGDTFFYDYYVLNDKKNYALTLQLCIDKKVQEYLTLKQKQKLKKYIFFDGKLESNTVPFIYTIF